MKVKNKEFYVCDFCEKESLDEEEIIKCEQIHQCEHDITYGFKKNFDSYQFIYNAYGECNICGYRQNAACGFELKESDEALLAESIIRATILIKEKRKTDGQLDK